MGISLLHALEATGIRLYAEGDQLRAEIPAGVDLAHRPPQTEATRATFRGIQIQRAAPDPGNGT